MTQRIALITGITGQDGSNLTDYLLSLDYCVHGIVRRQSVAENQTSRLSNVLDKVTLHYGDVTDLISVSRIVSEVRPDEVYNLAGMSHVGISSSVPHFTGSVNGLGVLHVLEAVRREWPKARMYQASSSEMFGTSVDADGYQRETTAMTPVSPYGAAKLYGYHITRVWRASYRLFAANGILFNHSSRRRGINFVEAKIAKSLAEIAAGKADVLELGDVRPSRDWGHSRDYVRAMHLILQHPEPDDWVIATGQTWSVWDFVTALCAEFGLDPAKCVKPGTERFLRPQELPYLRGDASKARNRLGWAPTHTFADIVKELADHWRAEVARNH